MASASVPAAAGAASVMAISSASSSTSSTTPLQRPHAKAMFFRLVPKPRLRLVSSSKVPRFNLGPRRSCVLVASSQMNEVMPGGGHHRYRPVINAASVALYILAVLYHGICLLCSKVVGGPSNDFAAAEQKPEVPAPPSKDGAEPSAEETPPAPVSPEAVSEFMTQVASLVKLVDSRDIIELQLKQQDCELIIRKKEALPQPPVPAPVIMMPPHGQTPILQSQPVPPPPAALALPAPPTPPAAAPKSAKSSLPPLKSPMAGTFYRSPGPAQPPFVKVGDKVNKGQVLCIIEAMKLMNEIEADQAGTVTEILVDDAKPVSIDQPLFVIEP